MRLPDELTEAIETAIAGTPGATLSRAAADFSDAYRTGKAAASAPLASAAHRLAYLAVRLPATYAATRRALGYVAERFDASDDAPEIRGVLDLGAGPGTASWAALDAFPEIAEATLVERDGELAALGRRLAAASSDAALAEATWRAADVGRLNTYPEADLVVASYVVGELDEKGARRLVESAFAAARSTVVIVEPGTPAGYERVLAARKLLIELGAHVVAPCPHDRVCPMTGNDWCHFSARLERTSLHRRVKAAAMGHEDEKFSYVAATKSPVPPTAARIVRHPLRRAGHTYLDLCRDDGLVRVAVTKSDRDAYRRVRKSEWGDEW